MSIDTKNLDRPQTWIPSRGKPLKNDNGETIGLLTKSKRFVVQEKQIFQQHNKFSLPKDKLENTIRYAAKYIDIVFTSKEGRRYLFRTTPEKFLEEGEQKGSIIEMRKSRFEHIYGEEEERFMESYELASTGQTSMNDWNR